MKYSSVNLSPWVTFSLLHSIFSLGRDFVRRQQAALRVPGDPIGSDLVFECCKLNSLISPLITLTRWGLCSILDPQEI